MNLIFLVEDNSNDEALVEIALKRQPLPYELTVARDGQEGLNCLFGAENDRKGKLRYLPSLILLDLNLPKASGFEVLQKIREHPRTRVIPVVIWSSSCETTDLEQAYSLGANSYVQKPTGFEQFSGAVHEIMSYWLKLNQSSSAVM
jgi:two-component system response regulator